MPELILYYRPTCPFCLKVLYFTKQNKISLALKNISDERLRQELITTGGKGQVPCLLIDGKPKYESEDIIQFLGEHYKK